MGILDDIREDIQDITSNSDEFGVEMTFSNGVVSKTVTGLHAKRHLINPEDGNDVNTKHSYVSVSEASFEDYPVRSGGMVAMIGHTVTVADSTGTEYTYKVRETLPDETVGLIVFRLGSI
jgi:hypothetical protein